MNNLLSLKKNLLIRFARFNTIITSLKALDEGFYRRNMLEVFRASTSSMESKGSRRLEKSKDFDDEDYAYGSKEALKRYLDEMNKGVQRNQQAFYYLENAAYQLPPDALYLMGAIYLTDECVKKDIASALRMDNLNITMEEYIRLEEEKAQKHKKVFNWETAKYGKIWYDEDIYDLRSVETEFPAIALNDGLSSEKTLSYEPTVSSLNNEIDFKISFDDSDDEDYTNEFSAIVYNDAQTSKSDLLTEPILSPQHINEFDLNDETSLSEYDEEERNILYFNDLFPFSIIHPNDLKSEKDNDDNKIDNSSGVANILEAKEASSGQVTPATDLENLKQRWELFRVSCDQAEEFVEPAKLRIGSECWVDVATGSVAGKPGQAVTPGLPLISAGRLEQISKVVRLLVIELQQSSRSA
ncbi:putative reverse transcriptase domain-containing protein [Tanacetum coccineum]|uniref:Reverse transcriptase domain-containing protein n=1 Tax=Tanacetum coccineum TaxID=301880 RepID=A0ABQ5F9E5_9ASTR